ncbi:MAG TPA: 1-phosphofructokinase, partial [Thermoanaerobaculia bacterium]|nr:1-phosphofructokinase [Thermoanaerobaculia bacterium]
LADIGVDVVATGFLGADNAQPFEETFASQGIADHFVRVDGATRVGLKIVDPGTQQATDINFPGLTPRPEQIEELLGRIAGLAGPDRWFVLSGSVPPGVPDGLYARIIETVHKKKGHVVLDTSGRPLREAIAARPEVMKPNADELSELAGRALETTAELRAAGELLLDGGVQRVVVSMGAGGALFVEDGEALLARPPRVEVRSTVGAGDAMVAGLLFATTQGLPLAEVARTATAAGAYAVTRIGSGVEDPAAWRELMAEVVIEPLTGRS